MTDRENARMAELRGAAVELSIAVEKVRTATASRIGKSPSRRGASVGYVTRTDHTICVVRGFLELSSTEVVMGLRNGGVMTPVLETAIKDAWRANGGRIWPGERYGLREIREG